MKRWLQRLDNTWSRIVLAFLVLVSVLLLTLGYLANQFETTMQDFRQQELRRITEIARASIDPVLDDYRKNKISHDQALHAVREIIRPMTYSDLFGPNYVFMSSYDGIMLVQPYEPALEGTNLSALTDPHGVRIIEALITKAREGSGFVSYSYHPPNRPELQRKISYVMGITELDAYIGTGIYIDDMEKYYAPFLNRLYIVCLAIFILTLSTLYLFLQPMFHSYNQLLGAFKRIGKTPDNSLQLSDSSYRSGSEAQLLISGFNTMVANIHQSIIERRQVELQLQQANLELTANHEELQASNEELLALYEQVASTSEALQIQYRELITKDTLLDRSEERYRLALEGARDTIFDWDPQANTLVWSARCSEVLGISSQELSRDQGAWKRRIHPEDRETRDAALRAHLSGKTPYYESEFRVMTGSGEYIWVLSRGKAMHNEQGRVMRMAGSFTDITEKKQREQQVWALAYQDALTGLPNRLLLTEQLQRELSTSSSGALFFLDIDNFKLVNDSCGHAQGDLLLVETACHLLAVVSQSTTVARVGGDEFIILMPEVCHADIIATQANLLLQALPKQYKMCGHNFALTVSIGIACYPRDGTNVDELLRNADTALYEVKNNGRNNWKLFDCNMHNELVRKLNLERDLQDALTRNEFQLQLQPIVNLPTGQIAGFEALLRWNSPNGMIPPLDFISMAEETGLIVPIGRWVLQDACRIANLLRALGWYDLYIAVNISLRQLDQDDFVSMVSELLATAKLPPSCIVLEITETLLMESFEANIAKLKQLKAMGISLSLDDFGTGYSSLTYLRKLPIDTVKIDKSFVDDLANSQPPLVMLSSIIVLAQNLGFKVVAEGVETAEQSKFLGDWHCDYIQGYLISPPLPIEQALDFLKPTRESD